MKEGSWAWWFPPLIPTTSETEAEGSQVLRPTWTTQRDPVSKRYAFVVLGIEPLTWAQASQVHFVTFLDLGSSSFLICSQIKKEISLP
jgi:hypothetical protein